MRRELVFKISCAQEVGMGLVKKTRLLCASIVVSEILFFRFFPRVANKALFRQHTSLCYATCRCITDERVYTMAMLCTGTVQIAAAVFYTATAG